jgi:hypothetical protein
MGGGGGGGPKGVAHASFDQGGVFFCLTLNLPDASEIVHGVLFLCSICHRGLSSAFFVGKFSRGRCHLVHRD